MELDFKRIERIRKIRSCMAALLREENTLSVPILRDTGKIKTIHNVFKRILDERGHPPDAESATMRKKFVFIAIYLYFPAALAGGRIKPGIREELSRALGVSGPVISKNCEDAVFLYTHYADFKEDVRHLYGAMTERLKALNVIK